MAHLARFLALQPFGFIGAMEDQPKFCVRRLIDFGFEGVVLPGQPVARDDFRARLLLVGCRGTGDAE